MAHYLALNKKLQTQVPNLKIYLVRKETASKERAIDIEAQHEPISRIGFWLANARHSLAQKVHELTYFTYIAEKLRLKWHEKDETEKFLLYDYEKPLDGITMAKDGTLVSEETG